MIATSRAPARALRHLLVLFALLTAGTTPVLAQISAESESNNTESTADGPIGSGRLVSGSMSTRTDIDWFHFDLATAGTINITLEHAKGRDFDWALFAASGTALARGATTAIPQSGSYNATAAGRYLVKVTAYSGSGAYTLNVTFAGTSGGGTDPRPAKPSNLQNWIAGNAENAARQPLNGPAVLLMGGGVENDSAFSARAFPIANGGDVVVLRTSGTNGYNDYLYGLVSGATRPDSVETLLLDTRTKADSDYAEWVIRNAEFVFMAGGDQSSYLNAWADTRTQSALRAAYARGAVIGGTSAGLAVLGEFVYDPDGVTAVTSPEAIANPYRTGMMFSGTLLNAPLLNDVITDSHFAQRDRMGRLLAFMARLRQDGTTARAVGVGVDETTSLFIDRTGLGVADGAGAVYVIEERADTQRTQVAAGQPLVYGNMRRTKLVAGQGFAFADGVTDGTSTVISVDGRNAAPLIPANAY